MYICMYIYACMYVCTYMYVYVCMYSLLLPGVCRVCRHISRTDQSVVLRLRHMSVYR